MSDDDDALAAETALGLLDADERRSAQARIARDAAFAAAVALWEARVAALFGGVADPPRPSLWPLIAARLAGNDVAPSRPSSPTLAWKLATLAACAVAMILGVAALERPRTPAPAATVVTPLPLVAVLTGKDSKAAVGVSFDPALQRLVISSTSLVASERSLQLWIIAPNHDPRSVGIVRRTASSLRTASDVAGLITAGATLAISIEPPGGSPTGQPTGPVVLNGVIEAI